MRLSLKLEWERVGETGRRTPITKGLTLFNTEIFSAKPFSKVIHYFLWPIWLIILLAQKVKEDPVWWLSGILCTCCVVCFVVGLIGVAIGIVWILRGIFAASTLWSWYSVAVVWGAGMFIFLGERLLGINEYKIRRFIENRRLKKGEG